jgi:hypothetical protein
MVIKQIFFAVVIHHFFLGLFDDLLNENSPITSEHQDSNGTEPVTNDDSSGGMHFQTTHLGKKFVFSSYVVT